MSQGTNLLPANSGILTNIDQRLGPIEYRRPETLTAYANNPRKHPEKQIVKLMASIGQFGFAIPVLVDADDTIIAGEARIEAARRLNLDEVPVIVADRWSKAQIRAYRLADNRLAELAVWDETALAVELAEIIEIDDVPIDILGWETAEVDVILEDKQEKSDPADEMPETPQVPVSRPGELWLLGPHRLLCASCLDQESWVRLMDGKVGDMLFTDAPFNVPISGHVSGLGKTSHAEFAFASGEMSEAEFTDFLTEAIARAAAHLKDGAVLDLFMDWRSIHTLYAACKANGLKLLNLCVWNKGNGGMGSLYRSKHELVVIARKGKAPHTNNVQLGRYGRYRSNVWDYAGANSFGSSRMADLGDHPTVKPVALVADAIRDVTKPGEIVLDGFMGSGSTILAATRTKRIAYGIEIEPRYIDVAIRRWESMTGQKAVLAETGESFGDLSASRLAEISPDPEDGSDI